MLEKREMNTYILIGVHDCISGECILSQGTNEVLIILLLMVEKNKTDINNVLTKKLRKFHVTRNIITTFIISFHIFCFLPFIFFSHYCIFISYSFSP